MKITNYIIDGSLESLLCAIFEWFERKPGRIVLKTIKEYQPEAFADVLYIHNDKQKAYRVWNGLRKKLNSSWIRKFYCGYLSETPEALSNLFELACYIFVNPNGAEYNYGNQYVLGVSQMAVKVEREKHRMEAFIRFKHLEDGTFYCGIAPDFNVLPLIIQHFKDRYADQKWIIYDIKRHYGIYYDLVVTKEIMIDKTEISKSNLSFPDQTSELEALYAKLWQDYFKSTNIASRKNTKLHVRHVPKRYWKYLTEKQDN